jgi:hypothetical protein
MASGDFIKRVSDSAKEFAETFADKAEDAFETLSDKAEDAFDVAKEKGAELKDKAQIAIGDRETPHLNRISEMYGLMGQGKMMDAFEQYYDDDVVMQENSEEPRRGKEVNRKYELAFLDNVEEMHGGGVGAITSNEAEGITMVESWMDVTIKGAPRTKMEEVAVQKWKGGKIIHERFYYKG